MGLHMPIPTCLQSPCVLRSIKLAKQHAVWGAGDWRLAVDQRVTEFELRLARSKNRLLAQRQRRNGTVAPPAFPHAVTAAPATALLSVSVQRARWKHRKWLETKTQRR